MATSKAATNPIFKGHSAAWVAGYNYGHMDGHIAGTFAADDRHAVDLWLMEQDRIDREMWIWTQGVIVGCLQVVAAYWIGRI